MGRRAGRAVVALVALALAAAACVPVASRGEPRNPRRVGGGFSLLTYNVAGLPEGISQSHPEASSPVIGRLINGYDLVVLQEDFGFYSHLIAGNATHPHRSDPHPGPKVENPIGRPTALVGDGLNRYSRLAFGDVVRVPWPGCFGGADTSDGGSGDCLALKGYSYGRHALGDDRWVDVYNLHVEAGNTPLDLALAADDLDVLAAEIESRSRGHAVIVAGDFNLHPDRPEEAAILDAFRARLRLIDVCDRVDCGDDANEIDRVMYRSGAGVALRAVSHTFERDTFVDAAGEPLSDHDPLAVDFVWRRQGCGGHSARTGHAGGCAHP